MIVSELIEILSKLPQDAFVETEGCDCNGPCGGAHVDGYGGVLLERDSSIERPQPPGPQPPSPEKIERQREARRQWLAENPPRPEPTREEGRAAIARLAARLRDSR